MSMLYNIGDYVVMSEICNKDLIGQIGHIKHKNKNGYNVMINGRLYNTDADDNSFVKRIECPEYLKILYKNKKYNKL